MTSPARPPATLLIVEDDDGAREAYRWAFEQEGFGVVCAEDGEVGLQRLAELGATVSLAIVDVMMPRQGGLAFLKHKATMPEVAAVPVIVLSAVADRVPLPETPDVRDVLVKPVEVAALIARIREIVG